MSHPVRTPAFFSLRRAREIQKRLARSLVLNDVLKEMPGSIAGVDVGYKRGIAVACAVLLEYPSLRVIEHAIITSKVHFPYIPTLLSFRELAPAFRALNSLERSPDVVMVDAHGYAHPYRLGLASHLGAVLKKPTIGVAKRLLCGKVGEWRGKWAPVIDKGEIVGAAVKLVEGAEPVYVSVGNMLSLDTAIKITFGASKGHRLPEPTRLAHLLASRALKRL